MNKLPLYKKFIENVSEISEQFHLRKCQIAVKRIQKEGLPLTAGRIKSLAHICSEDYEWIK